MGHERILTPGEVLSKKYYTRIRGGLKIQDESSPDTSDLIFVGDDITIGLPIDDIVFARPHKTDNPSYVCPIPFEDLLKMRRKDVEMLMFEGDMSRSGYFAIAVTIHKGNSSATKVYNLGEER